MSVLNTIKKNLDTYKKNKQDDRRFYKKQKELLKRDKEIEKEVEKEYKEQVKKENEEKYKGLSKKERLFSEFKEFIQDVLNNDELAELEQYKSEEEKKEDAIKRKEEKRLTIRVISIFASIIIIVGVGLLIFGEIIKSDLEKVTQPLLEDYYLKTFNEKPKLQTIKYLDKDKHIVLATFKSGINVMCIDNKNIGNDSSNDKLYEDYKAYLINNMQSPNFIIHKPKLSYIPYEVEYNYYIDYIDTLPSDLTFNDMINNHSLDIVDTIVYENDINKEGIKAMLNNFGNNSKIFLIKTNSQNIIEFSAITKDKIESFDVIEEKYSKDGDTFYLFNNDINKVEFVEIKNLPDGYDKNNNKYVNVKELEIDESYLSGVDRKDDLRSSYYLIRFKKGLTYDNFSVLSSASNTFYKYEDNNVPLVLGINTQSGFVMFGSGEVAIANQDNSSKSWLCSLNLC